MPPKQEKSVKKAKRDSGASYISLKSGVVVKKNQGSLAAVIICYNKVDNNIKLIFNAC